MVVVERDGVVEIWYLPFRDLLHMIFSLIFWKSDYYSVSTYGGLEGKGCQQNQF